MQCRAIFEAACNVQKAGIKVEPEIMIPLVGFLPELKAQAKIVHDTAKKVFAEKGVDGHVPGRHDDRAAAGLRGGRPDRQGGPVLQLRHQRPDADDLGMSRDDYGSFIRYYLEHDLVPKDPFQTIDFDGVGGLMKIGVEKGRGRAQGPEDRHLRRARRRSGHGQVLPQDRPELRELQPVPRADRPPGGGAGGAGEVNTAVRQVTENQGRKWATAALPPLKRLSRKTDAFADGSNALIRRWRASTAADGGVKCPLFSLWNVQEKSLWKGMWSGSFRNMGWMCLLLVERPDPDGRLVQVLGALGGFTQDTEQRTIWACTRDCGRCLLRETDTTCSLNNRTDLLAVHG